MNITEIKKRVCNEIDNNRDEIISTGNTIYRNPELGYKEIKTTELVSEVFRKLGLEYDKNPAVTGCIGTLQGGK